LYLHPDHFPYEILPVAQADTRILPYFDLPFQHASPKVLRAMNRRGGSEQYQTLIKTIRGALPGAAIRSTFLCGFPGETEEDFQVLLDFQQAAALTWIGCFRYSPEEGTPAAAHAATLGAVPSRKTAARRQEALERAQVPITARFLDALLDRQATVLVEAAAEAGAGVLVNAEENLYLGRLACSAPDVDGGVIIQTKNTLTPGTFARGVIRGRSGFDLLMAAPSVCGNGKGAGG
jgi:ribosomal protein S12 methylthiotransferase